MSEPEDVLTKADANASVVRRLYDECLNGKNFEMAETLISSSFEAGGTGPEGFLTIRSLHAAFDPIAFEIEDVVAQALPRANAP